MIITVDIGNSSINIGYFHNQNLIVQKIDTFPSKQTTSYQQLILDFARKKNIEISFFGVIISSVVSDLGQIFEQVFKEFPVGKLDTCLRADYRLNTGLQFLITSPEKMGTDRIANAVAAFQRYSSDVAVVDFGTATTITAVSSRGELIGGAILPGLGLMSTALGDRTSGLSRIRLIPPVVALGRETELCIRSGIFLGSAGAVERIVSEIEKEVSLRFSVILTGGYCMLMDEFIDRMHDSDPYLTLKGLKLLYEQNRHA